VSEGVLVGKEVLPSLRVKDLFEMIVIPISIQTLSLEKWSLKVDYDNFCPKFGI
jgi:hypothetical protein